jgi:hypothetical protein
LSTGVSTGHVVEGGEAAMLKRAQLVEPSTWVWAVAVVATVIVASSVVGSVLGLAWLPQYDWVARLMVKVV